MNEYTHQYSLASPNLDSARVIAIDLGGTNLRAAAISNKGEIQERLKRPTPRTGNPAEIVHALCVAARECAQALLSANEASSSTAIKALSVVVPGTVETKSGVLINAPNIPCLNNFPLQAALEKELSWPVILENDANAAALGEMWRGAARGMNTFLCLTLGTGVGGGIILDGELWRGVDGTAGEIGHMNVEPEGGPCSCGNRGCLEVYASATAIVRMAREMLAHYPQSSLKDSSELTAEKVYQSGVEEDELARAVFKRIGRYLGIALASLINLLNPEMIVIGGGAAAGWNLFINEVHKQVGERAFAVPAQSAQIVRAECGDDAGLLGAAYLAFARGAN
jgi:glucokinase